MSEEAKLAASLTAKETQLLAAAWMSCTTNPKPDYEKIAEICGYKNAGVASVMFGGVKRKLAKALGDGSPAKGKSPKKSAAPDAGDEAPKKSARTTKAMAKKSVKNEDPEDFSDILAPDDL